MRSRSRGKSGRQTEVIDRLAKRFGKFALVVAVFRRADDLKERIGSLGEPSGGKLINRAITEIARGDVRIRGGLGSGEEVGEG
jgi:DNA-directed RNA polymerase subunit K/omega